jgi:hypothetical protein
VVVETTTLRSSGGVQAMKRRAETEPRGDKRDRDPTQTLCWGMVWHGTACPPQTSGKLSYLPLCTLKQLAVHGLLPMAVSRIAKFGQLSKSAGHPESMPGSPKTATQNSPS